MGEQVKDYYAILEVEKTATDKEIKASYRKLAAKYHPDVCQEENAQELFQRIVEAYDVLSDSDSRKEYDEFTKMMNEGRNISFKDLYEKFHSTQMGAHTPVKGDDVEMQLEFFVSDIRRELIKQIVFDRYGNCEDCSGHGFRRDSAHICPECNGKGFSLINSKTPFGEIKTESNCVGCKGKGYIDIENCSTCKGKGKKITPVQIQFSLPRNVTEGYRLILKEKGDAGINGGRNGDLILILTQSPDDPFKMVNDYDVQARLDIPFIKALAGGQVDFTLPNGKVMTIPIERGTQTGAKIVIPEAGLFNPNNGFYGILTLEANILVPHVLGEDKVQKLISILG